MHVKNELLCLIFIYDDFYCIWKEDFLFFDKMLRFGSSPVREIYPHYLNSGRNKNGGNKMKILSTKLTPQAGGGVSCRLLCSVENSEVLKRTEAYLCEFVLVQKLSLELSNREVCSQGRVNIL